MTSIPFKKALLFLTIVEGENRASKIGALSEEFLPLYFFDFPLMSTAKTILKDEPVPKAVLGDDPVDEQTIAYFIRAVDLVDLAVSWPAPEFQSLLHDYDTVKKISILSMSGMRAREISETFSEYPEEMVELYLRCFCDFSEMGFIEKKNFIINTVEPSEQKIWLRCLENKSPRFLRTALGIKTKSIDPMLLANRVTDAISMKIETAIADGDDKSLQQYLKLGMQASQLLQKLGSGNQNSIEELLKALNEIQPSEKGTTTIFKPADLVNM